MYTENTNAVGRADDVGPEILFPKCQLPRLNQGI